jgi:5-methylcytosine-specific restriction enzyme A
MSWNAGVDADVLSSRPNRYALCASKRGIVTAATVADHITPHNGDWNAFLAAALQSLCKPCHDSDKRYMDLHGKPRPIIGEDGWPIEP